MTKCFRCGNPMPEPDIKEAINRELDWRDQFPDEPDSERVLICTPCADELENIE